MDTTSLKDYRVLYVEDEENLRNMVGTILRRRMGEVILAGDGKEGILCFKRSRPDLVITDMEMPVMNGLEMVRRIRQFNTSTPILLLTAYREEAENARGVDQVLHKPIDKNELIRSVQEAIEKSKR